MDIDQDDIDETYKNLTSQYEGGERAIVSLFRSKSPILMENMIQAISEYGPDFTAEEVDFLIRALDQRISAASKKLPLTLSNEQKVQVQRFYGTNAGASFINTQMRNTRLKPDQAIPLTYRDLDSAVAAAANENTSEGKLAFSTAGRQAIKQAFALGDVQKVMRAALEGGDLHYSTPQYRGTRVPKDLLETFNVGDILVNTFFMSFSPDIMKPTKRGDDEKVHDGFKQARTFVGDKYKSHKGEAVIYELPARSEYKTTVIHSLYEHETVLPPMTVLAIDSIQKEESYTRIRLKKKPAAEADAKKTGANKPRQLYMLH